MEYLGAVTKLEGNKAYLMTSTLEVVCIRRQPGMYVGLEVYFEESEKINSKNTFVKYSAVMASVAAVFIVIMFYIGLINSNQIYAYVDVDINTNWQFMVNKNNKVIDIKINDNNSKFLIEDLNFKSKPLENVLVDMVEKLDQKGLIDLNSPNKVLIATCLQGDDLKQADNKGLKKLHSSYNKIKDEFLNRNIQTYFLEAKSEDRKLAADNNISMGRYSIYKISKEKGIDIDLEKLKQNQINEILEKVDIDSKENITEDNTNKINQDSSNKDYSKDNNADKSGGGSYKGEDIDLSLDGIDDLDIIKSIEAANIETQKVIQKIQQQVNTDIAFETEKANKEISKIKMDPNMSNEQKNEKIKQIELELIRKINEIKKIGNEKAQAEVDKLEKKASELLPQIN